MAYYSGATFYAPESLTNILIAGNSFGGTYAGQGATVPSSYSSNIVVSDLGAMTWISGNTAAGGFDRLIWSNYSHEGSGGAILTPVRGNISISGCTFDHVVIGGTHTDRKNNARGGAVCAIDTLNIGVSANGQATIFNGNTANGAGGAVYSAYALTIDGATFSGNSSGNHGGAVNHGGRSATVTNSLFVNNYSFYNGAALYLGPAAGYPSSITGSTFSGNWTSASGKGGAVYLNSGSLTISGSTFVTATDTIYINSGATLTLTGTNAIGASITSTTTVTVTDATLLFGNTAAISVASLSFTGSTNSIVLKGNREVAFASQSLSGVTLGVDGALEVGTFTLASGITSSLGDTISVNGYSVAFDDAHVSQANTDFIQKVSFADGTLSLQSADTIRIGYDAGDGFSSFATYEDYLAAGYNGFTGTIDENGAVSATIYAPGGVNRVVVNGTPYVGPNAGTAAPATIDTFSVVSDVTWNSRIVNGATASVIFNDATITDGYGTTSGGAFFGGTVSSVFLFDGEVSDNFSNGYHTDGKNYSRGGAFYVDGATFSATGTVFSGNTSKGLGGAFCTSNSYVFVTDAVFDGNRSQSQHGGAFYSSGSSTSVTNSVFTGNLAITNGGAIFIQNNTTGTITGSTFSGNSSINGGAVYIDRGAVTISGSTFVTASDSIFVNTPTTGTASLTFGGVNFLNAGIAGTGPVSVAAGAELIFGNTVAIDVVNLNFAGSNAVTLNGAVVNFTSQDLSAVALTVNGALWTGSDVTVATGVSGLGSYTIDGGDDHLKLKRESDALILYVKADVDDNTCIDSFSGGTSNLMTGGTITGAYVGIRNAAAGTDVENVISGGTVGNSLIGGALVSQGSKATLGTVSLTIAGTTDIVGGAPNGGMVYTAGYAYGANPSVLDSSATLTVTKSVLNLTEGTAPAQNLYAGAHARKGAYTVVNQTEVNVSGGSFARVYGGGWAEKVGKSEVGSSTITVTGGTLDYIYAGGGNAEGGTTVVTGAVNIAVSGDASVGIAFLAGKNQNCTTSGAVTMTVSGDAKTMTRVSGWNANGQENTSLTTLDLRTSLDVEYLDHVDIVRIAEGSTLNVSADLWYEAASALKIDFDLDGALDTDWTAMSGVGMNIYRSALYTIDGGDVVYTYDGESGKLVNGTTESGYGLKFTSDNKVKFVAATNL